MSMMTLQEFIKQECELVIQHVCDTHLVDRDDLLGKSKTVDLVRARRVAIRLLIGRGFSFTHIGNALGRNKATIHYWSEPKYRERQKRYMRKWNAARKQVGIVHDLQHS